MEFIRNDRSHDSQRKKERTFHFINKKPEKDRRKTLEQAAATIKHAAITVTNATTDFFFSGIKECCNLPPNATLWHRTIAAGKASLDVAALVPAVRLITLTANSVKVGTTLSKTIQASHSLRITNQVEKTAQVGKIGEQVVRGWKVGDPITNFTSKGSLPQWSTVRQRYWKNEAYLNPNEYAESNLLRMREGLAEQRINPNTRLLESRELHHHPVPQREGGLFDFIKVWPDEHRKLDLFRY